MVVISFLACWSFGTRAHYDWATAVTPDVMASFCVPGEAFPSWAVCSLNAWSLEFQGQEDGFPSGSLGKRAIRVSSPAATHFQDPTVGDAAPDDSC